VFRIAALILSILAYITERGRPESQPSTMMAVAALECLGEQFSPVLPQYSSILLFKVYFSPGQTRIRLRIGSNVLPHYECPLKT